MVLALVLLALLVLRVLLAGAAAASPSLPLLSRRYVAEEMSCCLTQGRSVFMESLQGGQLLRQQETLQHVEAVHAE